MIYMVPYTRAEDYASVTYQLMVAVQKNLGLGDGEIELIGLVASTALNGTEGIYSLEESGVDTRSLSVLILWGETNSSVDFQGAVSTECGVGKLILPATGVVLPTVLLPSLEGDWWLNSFNQTYAIALLTRLVKNGKDELDGSEPFVMIAGAHTWN